MVQASDSLLLAIGVWMGASAPVAVTGQPHPADVVPLAPIVTSQNASYDRVKVRWYSKEGESADLAYSATYRAPDAFALQIEIARDGRPLLFISKNQLLLYNAVDGVVLYLSSVRFDVNCQFRDNALTMTYGIRWAAMKTDKPSTIHFDLMSLFAPGGGRDDISPAGCGTFKLTRRTDKGQSIVARIEPAMRCPYKAIAYTGEGQRDPNFIIHDISVGQDVSDQCPPFPSKDTLATRVSVQDWSPTAEESDQAIAAFIEKALFGRLAIADKAWRPQYEGWYHVKIDWDQVELTDRRISEVIRVLLKPPR